MLTIPAGSSSTNLQLLVIGDLLKEGNERFDIRFSQPSGLVFNGDSVSRVMIIDDDRSFKNLSTLVVPNSTRRNQVWHIPGIEGFQNEIFIMNGYGQLIRHFTNYRNQSSLGNLTAGFYFYRIQTKEEGEFKLYSGRLLVTE